MIIELLNGTRLDIENYGLKRLFHYIPSAEINHTTTNVEGRGEIITDSFINQRTIRVEFGFRAADIYDYYLLRDELNALFLRREAFYIIFKREPYKRWLVKIAGQFEVPPTPRLGSFEVEFRTVKKYAESIATTNSLKEWDVDLWAWNGAITWDGDYNYSFNANNFTVNNLGSAIVDPRESDLEITIKGNFSQGLQINNVTTNELYEYNAPLSNSDTLRIDGVRTYKNGNSDFKNTNKRIITLHPGNNVISISGGIVSSVNFNFRFLYN